ncbi:MBL fold metallo-hydrolase [Bacillus thuringiensis]|uniref:MBL fold metallo-hydrolase n=1 Tax=Bacillus thuringiensis TaxID=1428 RepID=UPI000E4D8A9D|nr:MBL fold metallo-hydrolase [Bacillus thuringiensis]MDZ3952310.1 MBL fold metallo-hydrolase [Bacillus thuringiensis]RGP42309.1 MBL fold metallo-hydrolase [Bacillus thuringiensis]
MKRVEQLAEQLYIIDDYDFQLSQRTGTYVLLGNDITLIETCSSPSVPYILKGLHELNISLDTIKNIVVTHIHLDHAGAAGLLMEKCPNATLYVHEQDAFHMMDPTKLIEGTKKVYGKLFEIFFSPIVPVQEERICKVNNGDILPISPKRVLTFYEMPGHTKNHLCIYDSLTNGIFTGDTLGIYYRELKGLGVELYLPSTSPTQFQPEKMLESIERLKALQIDYIFFGHYGASTNVSEVYKQLESWISFFLNSGKEVVGRCNNPQKEDASFRFAESILSEL